MPNITSLLKAEIIRLAKKEVRNELEGLKKASSLHRTEIAALKRRVAVLEKQVASAEKMGGKQITPLADTTENTRIRFSVKRLASQRQKLGLSAADMGALLGVSGQTIYHWEAGKTRPRQQQLVALARARKLGKREAQAQLKKLKACG